VKDFGYTVLWSHIDLTFTVKFHIGMTVMVLAWWRVTVSTAIGGLEKYHVVGECTHVTALFLR
jgi:hypothetical protein